MRKSSRTTSIGDSVNQAVQPAARRRAETGRHASLVMSLGSGPTLDRVSRLACHPQSRTETGSHDYTSLRGGHFASAKGTSTLAMTGCTAPLPATAEYRGATGGLPEGLTKASLANRVEALQHQTSKFAASSLHLRRPVRELFPLTEFRPQGLRTPSIRGLSLIHI